MFKKGQSSIEVVVAIALVAFIFTGMFLLFGSALVDSNALLQRSKAEDILTESLEAARQIRNRDWAEIVPGEHGLALVGDTWQFSGTSDTIDETFERIVEITRVNDGEMDMEVTVSWEARPGDLQTVSAFSRLTSWQTLEIHGDWWNPFIAGSADIGPQGRGTDVLSHGNVAYITADISSGTVPSLFAFDVSNPASPSLLTSYVTGDGLSSLAMSEDGSTLYTVGAGDGDELQVFNVTNPSVLDQVTTVPLAQDGVSIFVQGGYLYAGTSTGLEIFNISTPSSPVPVSNFALGSSINGVVVTNGFAYLATADDAKELLVLNVANPASPFEVSSFDTSGGIDGKGIAWREERLYLGTLNNSSSGTEFYIFDIENPASPSLLRAFDIGGTINTMEAIANYVYFATDLSNQEFLVYDVHDPQDLRLVAGLNMAQVATGLSYSDNSIYISLRSNDAFQIIQPSP